MKNKATAYSSAFALAAGLFVSTASQAQDTNVILQSQDIDSAGIVLPGDPTGDWTRIKSSFKAVLIKDPSGNLAQCTWLKLEFNDQEKIKILNRNITLETSWRSVADALRPDPFQQNLDYLSYGSCVPYETKLSPKAVELLRKLDYAGFIKEAGFPIAVKSALAMQDREGQMRWSAAVGMFNDPAREERLKNEGADFTLDDPPCINTGSREGRPWDFEPRQCP